MPAARLLVISGPSGAGKSAVVKRIQELRPQAALALSATTRPPRPGEKDGVDYRFVGAAGFDGLLRDGGLLEWAVVHGVHRYGTLQADVRAKLAQGRLVLLDVDLQGLKSIKKIYPHVISVYLLPPSDREWVRRLESRGIEDADDFQRRLATAQAEKREQHLYSLRVVNDDLDRACGEILALVDDARP